jgi:hypothetical protein
VNNTRYSFVPKPEICDWIDEKIIKKGRGWTAYCYDNIYKDQKKEYHEYRKKIGTGISIILFGMIFLSITFLTTAFLYLYLTITVTAVWFIIMGCYITSWEIKNGR